MYEASRSAVLLEGEKSAMFRVEQGVAQGCCSLPTLFFNDLLKEVEQAKHGVVVQFRSVFADDFVGVSDSKEVCRSLYRCCTYIHTCKLRLKANVSKSAVMVFSKLL